MTLSNEPDFGRAANLMCAWLLEHVDGETHQTLCELHPSVWKEAAEVAIRAGRHEFDCRPFTTSSAALPGCLDAVYHERERIREALLSGEAIEAASWRKTDPDTARLVVRAALSVALPGGRRDS